MATTSAPRWTIHARWVFPVDGPPLENATVEIDAGRIAALESVRAKAYFIGEDLGTGRRAGQQRRPVVQAAQLVVRAAAEQRPRARGHGAGQESRPGSGELDISCHPLVA
jgi:hypothetical protein